MAEDERESFLVSEIRSIDWLRRQYLVELDGPVDFKFEYQSLKPGQIRLLEVWPGEPGELLRCSIHVAVRDLDVEGDKLYKPIEYEAISYVWGNPDRSLELKCDRANWVIGRRQPREQSEDGDNDSAAGSDNSEEHPSSSEVTQESHEEQTVSSDARPEELATAEETSNYSETESDDDAESDSDDRVVMTVYSGDFDASATTVMITGSAHKLIHGLRDPHEARILWIDGICINQDDFDERATQVAMMKDIYAGATQVLVWLGDETPDTAGAFSIARRLARILNERSWTEEEARERAKWPGFRPWQLPEDHALYINHDDWLAFKTKLLYLPWFERTWVFQELALSQQATMVWGSERVDWETLRDACDAVAELSIVIGNHHRHRMVQKMNERAEAYHRLQEILNRRQGSLDMEDVQALSLQFLLRDVRALQASDPRDKVFGVFGLAIMRQDGPIEISYTAPVRDVYTQACEHLLRDPSTRHLQCLSWVQEANSELCLPSWVPDWSTAWQTQPINVIAKTKAARARKAKFKVLWNYISDESLCLKRWGKIVPCHCLQVQGVQLMQVAMLVDRSDDDRLAELLNSLPVLYPMTHATYLDVYSKIFEPVESQDFQLGKLRNVQQSFWNFQRPATFNSPERCGRRSEDDPAILTSQLEKLRPFGVHIVPTTAASERPMWDYRTVFVSPTGFMGIVPRNTLPGDKIALFMGAAVPFVIRPIEGHYLLIGECYVLGVMDGEALENLDEDRIEDFVLC